MGGWGSDGGGPAGSTVSTLLAQQGVTVQLFERERFPRFHIGESLIPETYWVLKRLNMLPKMQEEPLRQEVQRPVRELARGKESAPFYFWDNKPHECSQTWQVVRSEFDQMMLDNAREHGVDVHEGVRVHDVLFEGDRAVGVRITDEGRAVPRGAREGRRRCQRPERPDHEPAQPARLGSDPQQGRDLDLLGRARIATPGATKGATLVIQTGNKKGWFWYIPQHDNIVSVGVVAPFDYLFKGRGSYAQTYEEEVELCPGVKERVAKAQARHRLLRDQGLLVSLDAGGGRRLGAGRRRVRLPRSAVLVRRAAGAEVGRAGRRRDRRGTGEGRHVGGAARQVGADLQRGRGPHPTWNAGIGNASVATDKENLLVLPERPASYARCAVSSANFVLVVIACTTWRGAERAKKTLPASRGPHRDIKRGALD